MNKITKIGLTVLMIAIILGCILLYLHAKGERSFADYLGTDEDLDNTGDVILPDYVTSEDFYNDVYDTIKGEEETYFVNMDEYTEAVPTKYRLALSSSCGAALPDMMTFTYFDEDTGYIYGECSYGTIVYEFHDDDVVQYTSTFTSNK